MMTEKVSGVIISHGAFAITHLIDTGVGVGNELTDRCTHIWLYRINMHRDLGNYYTGRQWLE